MAPGPHPGTPSRTRWCAPGRIRCPHFSRRTAGPVAAVQGPAGPAGAIGPTGPAGLPAHMVDVTGYADLATAVSTIGSTVTTLVIASAVSITVDLTIPATLSLLFAGQGKISVPTGHTLTINGAVSAPPVQIFALTGTGKVTFGVGSIAAVWVEWFGARADATTTSGSGTNSTAGIQAAINSVPAYGGIEVWFCGGTYRVTSSLSIIYTTTGT